MKRLILRALIVLAILTTTMGLAYLNGLLWMHTLSADTATLVAIPTGALIGVIGAFGVTWKLYGWLYE